MSFRLLYRLELDENGKFLWNKWVEQKLADRSSHTVSVQMNYQCWPGIWFSPGYFIFTRRGYRYTTGLQASTDKEKNIDFRSYGPTLSVSYEGSRLICRFTGSTMATQTQHSNKKILTRIDLRLSWLF
jgi:hypothetical protein